MLLLDIGVFVVACFALVKSASWSVRSIARIAKHSLGLSEFFVAFVIAGFISILPELFIGINSALVGRPEIGIGTIVGSNVADLTIVIGLVALAGRKINIDGNVMKNNIWFLLLATLPAFFMLDGTISRDDGIYLVVVFLLYIYHVSKREKVFNGTKKKKVNVGKNAAIFLLSMAALFVSAHFVTQSAVNISVGFMIPSILIGLFLVAIGTTLPELTLSLKAVMSKHKEVALGDVLGNVAIDSTFSIGVVAMISPITVGVSVFETSIVFMVLSAVALFIIVQDKKITWAESLFLFLVYAVFAIVELGALF